MTPAADVQSATQVELEVPASSTPVSVMAALNLPPALCALVILNGVFVRVAERASSMATFSRSGLPLLVADDDRYPIAGH